MVWWSRNYIIIADTPSLVTEEPFISVALGSLGCRLETTRLYYNFNPPHAGHPHIKSNEARGVGLYYNWGTEFDGYDKILHDGVKDFVIELTKELESEKFSSLKKN